MSCMLFLACFTKCSVKCTHRIRVTFKRNVITSPKRWGIFTESELVIKTCSVKAAGETLPLCLIADEPVILNTSQRR